MTARTSPASAGSATSAGRWSAARFQARRARSHSGWPGATMSPVRTGSSVSRVSVVEHADDAPARPVPDASGDSLPVPRRPGVSRAPTARTSGAGAATSRLRRTWRSIPPGANRSEECWTASPEPRCMISSSSSTAVAPWTSSARPARSRLERSRGRTCVTAKAICTPCSSSTSSTMLAALDRAPQPLVRPAAAMPGRTMSRITATGSPSARIVRVIVSAARVGRAARTPRRPPRRCRCSAISRSRTVSATPRRSASSE